MSWGILTEISNLREHVSEEDNWDVLEDKCRKAYESMLIGPERMALRYLMIDYDLVNIEDMTFEEKLFIPSFEFDGFEDYTRMGHYAAATYSQIRRHAVARGVTHCNLNGHISSKLLTGLNIGMDMSDQLREQYKVLEEVLST